jgi:hypothetical protein
MMDRLLHCLSLVIALNVIHAAAKVSSQSDHAPSGFTDSAAIDPSEGPTKSGYNFSGSIAKFSALVVAGK